MLSAPTLETRSRERKPSDSLAGRKWFDCAECHQEQEDHQLLQKFDMVFTEQAYHLLTFSNESIDICL